jgi:hypothetical protein
VEKAAITPATPSSVLTPNVSFERYACAKAQARKIDADGSLGEVLRSGSLGDSIRETTIIDASSSASSGSADNLAIRKIQNAATGVYCQKRGL